MTCNLLIIKHVLKNICGDDARCILALVMQDQALIPEKYFHSFMVQDTYCTLGRLTLILK